MKLIDRLNTRNLYARLLKEKDILDKRSNIFTDNKYNVPQKLDNDLLINKMAIDSYKAELLNSEYNQNRMTGVGYELLLNKFGAVDGNKIYWEFSQNYDIANIAENFEFRSKNNFAQYEVKKARTLIKYAKKLK